MESFELPGAPALQDLPWSIGPYGANPNLAGCGRQQRANLVAGRAVRVDAQAVLCAEAVGNRPVLPVVQAIVLSADPDAALGIRGHALGEGDGPSVFGRQGCPTLARVPQDFPVWPEDRPQQPGGILTDGPHRRQRGGGTDGQQLHDTGLQLAQAATARADPQISLPVVRKGDDGLLGHGRCRHSRVIEAEQPRLPRSEPQETVTVFVKCRRGYQGRIGRQRAQLDRGTALGEPPDLPVLVTPDPSCTATGDEPGRQLLQRAEFPIPIDSHPIPPGKPQ